MMPEISDETLMAFADGVLDEPQFSHVAEAIETNADLAARLEALVTGSTLARRGFEELLSPVSPALDTAVRETIRNAGRKPFWRVTWPNWLYPAGALAATAIVAVVAMPTLRPAPNNAVTSGIAELTGGEVSTILDTVPSGTRQTLATGTVIHPIATFINGDDRLCREFETQGNANYLVVSCRADSTWSVQLALVMAAEDGNYRPASGFGVLDAYLLSAGAGEPLSGDDELSALGIKMR